MSNRLSRSELKTLHFSIFTICVGVVMLYFCTEAVLIPAVRSIGLEKTTCKFTGRRLLTKGNSGGNIFSSCSTEHNQQGWRCNQVLVQYESPLLVKLLHKNEEKYLQRKNISISRLKVDVGELQHNHEEENDASLRKQQNAVLYINDVVLLYHGECSYHIHSPNELPHLLSLEYALFHDRTRIPGTTFSCYYDPKDLTVAVMFRTFTHMTIFHSVFWALLLIFLGILLFCLVYFWIGRLKK